MEALALPPPDEAARTLTRALLALPHAALAYTDAATGTPGISRIALGRVPEGAPATLISGLAPHFDGLARNPDCALLLGEPGGKGDPLTHPRLMIRARARFVAQDDPRRPALRDLWLRDHPKAKLYVDFADFAFVRFDPVSALLNAGFGKAYALTPADLAG